MPSYSHSSSSREDRTNDNLPDVPDNLHFQVRLSRLPPKDMWIPTESFIPDSSHGIWTYVEDDDCRMIVYETINQAVMDILESDVDYIYDSIARDLMNIWEWP